MATAEPTTELLAEWDEHAYREAWRLEQAWLLPAGYCAHYFPLQHERDVAEADRIYACLLYAGDLHSFRALLHGRPVPRTSLAPELARIA